MSLAGFRAIVGQATLFQPSGITRKTLSVDCFNFTSCRGEEPIRFVWKTIQPEIDLNSQHPTQKASAPLHELALHLFNGFLFYIQCLL